MANEWLKQVKSRSLHHLDIQLGLFLLELSCNLSITTPDGPWHPSEHTSTYQQSSSLFADRYGPGQVIPSAARRGIGPS